MLLIACFITILLLTIREYILKCNNRKKRTLQDEKQQHQKTKYDIIDLTNENSSNSFSSSGSGFLPHPASSSQISTISNRVLTNQLRELGFSMEDIINTVKDEKNLEEAVETLLACKALSNSSMQRGTSSSSSSNTDKVFCAVMQDSYPSSECLRINCKCSHRFSVEALIGHVRSSLLNSEQPVIPACPMANIGKMGDYNRCDYAMFEQDVETILDLGLAKGLIESAGAQAVWSKAKELYLAQAHRLNGHIRCISCPGLNNEGVWFELATSNSRRSTQLSGGAAPSRRGQRITCPVCGTEFCSNCNGTPYHFHCDCDALLGHLQAWMDWAKPGGRRDTFIAEDKALQEVIAQNTKKREAEEAELRKALEALQADELYKEKNCRLCPKCSRIIERVQLFVVHIHTATITPIFFSQVSGCDHMMCGDGTQKGCGSSFNWRTAPKYKANVSVPPSLEKAAAEGTKLSCTH